MLSKIKNSSARDKEEYQSMFVSLVYGKESPEINETGSLIDDNRVMDVIKKSREGISYKDYNNVYSKIEALNKEDWAKLFHIHLRTLERIQKDKRDLDISQSEKLLEFAKLFDYGVEVFGNKQKFEKWLERPSGALGGNIPKEFLDTSHGIKMVEQTLGKIEYGVFV